ncbi:MAG: 50S ribosomal protein L30 [Candidatus Marinimicrobia bacterium]|jgi:large subunit ribosomal protein L30|nr:50S ribosomal protein L30 [Candidatus Neomarinimicrobiota bacterium]MDP6297126.1 50S ribosomal protein L30 [Candidatus Neomarinimicrobiota bacterium]MDP7122575.1 50S ribosomal protein L30 [Candidatus Neomarinimicrobiota bacterium]MDP7483549.1 50S ribosomal protein L30 [Candidatus Neomarinimicrobiota bacterium]MDP7528062.1 50S ribosomal protein L30 [Candidatus Neomarinimicrobiota bacterium]|tara:strand:- start:5415 stop:5612 length:198 start_codon:yes stop_codon:yes gene_type:complete
MAKKSPKSLQITQIKSAIGYSQKAKKTLRALGLRKMHQSVVHTDTPVIRGMVNKISFLLKVDEAL